MLLSSMRLNARLQLARLFVFRRPSSVSRTLDKRKEWPRLCLLGLLWLFLAACAVLLGLAIFESWPPVALALAAGVLAACGILQTRIAHLERSRKLPRWVVPSVEEGRFVCSFDEPLLYSWIRAWQWRTVIAVVACLACFGAQRLPVFQASLLPAGVAETGWLMPVIHGAVKALPAVLGLFFLCVAMPRRALARQAKKVLEKRAAHSQQQIARSSGIEGFDAAMEALFSQFSRRRPLTYREAIENRMRAEPVLALLQPESVTTMVKAVMEVARQDLKNAAGALESMRRVERSAHALQSLSSVLREPLVEIKADQFVERQQRLGELVARRQWEDIEREARELEKEIGAAGAILHERSVKPAGPVLAPRTDPYGLLGASAGASTAAIRKLRLRLAQIYHPDIGGETSNAAKMAELNAAYDMVMRERER